MVALLTSYTHRVLLLPWKNDVPGALFTLFIVHLRFYPPHCGSGRRDNWYALSVSDAVSVTSVIFVCIGPISVVFGDYSRAVWDDSFRCALWSDYLLSRL